MMERVLLWKRCWIREREGDCGGSRLLEQKVKACKGKSNFAKTCHAAAAATSAHAGLGATAADFQPMIRDWTDYNPLLP